MAARWLGRNLVNIITVVVLPLLAGRVGGARLLPCAANSPPTSSCC